MNLAARQSWPFLLILAAGLVAPFAFPTYSNEIAVLWLMIVFASTWDILGGQMGYNSLGNIFFFGAGMYICAIVQIGLYYDVGMYTSGARTTHIVFTTAQYFTGFALGTVAAGIASAALAIVAGWIVLALRGPYFAIGTLGIAIAAAELISSWEWVGAASGISMPVFPYGPETQKLFFYFLLFALAFVLLVFLRWLYATNFGLALNAIRDDEEKAEAMGLHTRRYKRTAWAISAVFLGIAGAIFGNMTGFIEPRDIAFPTTTFNIFM
ncbi:MAG: branched-chain amino acid ABC transporter permease, partial [Nevskiales bacterium]